MFVLRKKRKVSQGQHTPCGISISPKKQDYHVRRNMYMFQMQQPITQMPIFKQANISWNEAHIGYV